MGAPVSAAEMGAGGAPAGGVIGVVGGALLAVKELAAAPGCTNGTTAGACCAAGEANGIGAESGGADGGGIGGATGGPTGGVAGAPPGLAGAVLHFTRRIVVGTADWLIGNASGIGAFLMVSVDAVCEAVSCFFSDSTGGSLMDSEGVGSAKNEVMAAAETKADGWGSAKNESSS